MTRAKRAILVSGVWCLFAALTLSGSGAWASPAPAQSGDLQSVIAQLNAASAKFKSAQADFSWDTYQAVVQVHDTQTGVIYFERVGGATRMGAYFQAQGSQTPTKIVVYNGGQLEYYQPSLKQMDIYRAGANSGQMESALTLGFGGSGTDLEKNWDVSLLGREKINGTDTVKLDLKPKDPKIQQNFTHITIWVDPTRSISLKQIAYEPSGDQRTCLYTNIKYNQAVNPDLFHIKPVSGTDIRTH